MPLLGLNFFEGGPEPSTAFLFCSVMLMIAVFVSMVHVNVELYASLAARRLQLQRKLLIGIRGFTGDYQRARCKPSLGAFACLNLTIVLNTA